MSSLALFRSVRFNIGLFFAIALASAVGTLLPQASETPEKVDVFLRTYPAWGRVCSNLGLFRLYESWWYLGLLVLMAFDIVVCKLWSAPPDAGGAALPPELDPREAGAQALDRAAAAVPLKPFHGAFTAPGAPQGAAEALRRALAGEGYHVHGAAEEGGGGRAAFSASRHRAQRWGSYVAHVALVVILTGGLLKQVYGFVEMVPVLEGGSRAMQVRPEWALHVDRFEVQYYEGTGTPKRFSSDLRVTDARDGREVGRKTIVVNDPLDIGGVRFYQASWGAGGMFRSVTLRVGTQELRVPQRTPTRIPGTPIEIVADMMLPNFTVGPDGRAGSGSLDLTNPAVRLRFRVDGRQTRSLWLLQRQNGLAFAEDEDGTLRQAPRPPFELAGLDPVLFSGIQVAYDPGYPVVLAGALAWLTGMVLLFYLHRRKLWLVVGPGADGRVRVLVGAWSSRGPRDFQGEFDALLSRLSARLEGAVSQPAV